MVVHARVFVSHVGGLELNREFLLSHGVNPEAEDDSPFPTELIYCHGHERIHGKQECTIVNALKLPVNESLPEVYRRAR